MAGNGKIWNSLGAALAVALLTVGTTQAQETLIVNSYGGAYEAVQKKVVVEPFEKKYGVKVQVVTILSNDVLAQLRATKAAPQFDVVQFSGGQEVIAAKEGLLHPLTLDDLPENGKNLYPFAVENIARGEGPVIMLSAVGLAYNTQTAPKAPKAWADLWDPVFNEHIVLTDLSNNLGWATFLMVNKIEGGDLTNPQKGFEALSKLLDDNVLVTTSPEVSQNFAQNDAWIAPLSAEYTYTMKKAGLPVAFVAPEEGTFGTYLTASVVANRPNQDLAKKFIDFSVSPEVQAAWAEEMRYSPTNKETKLRPELAAEVFYGADKIAGLVHFDPTEVSAVRAALLAEWKKLIAK